MNIIILGSTGSIGKATINVLKKSKTKINIKLLTTNNNFKVLYHQSIQFNCKNVVIFNKDKFLKSKYRNKFKKKK